MKTPAIRLWHFFLLVGTLLSLAGNLISMLYFIDSAKTNAWRVVNHGVSEWAVAPEWGRCQRIAQRIDADSAFLKLGGRQGDRVCSHPAIERFRNLTKDKAISLEVIGVDGTSRTISLPTLDYRLTPADWAEGIGQPLHDILYLLVGLYIGWLGAQQMHLRYLSLGLLMWSFLTPAYVPDLLLHYYDALALVVRANLVAFIFFAVASPELCPQRAAPVAALVRRWLPWYALFCLVGIVLNALTSFSGWNGSLDEYWKLAANLLGYLISISLLSAYYLLAHGNMRKRIQLLLPVFCLSLLPQLQPSFYVSYPVTKEAWAICLQYLAGSVMPVGLAYAVLRHRVFDVGFALNRAIMFSTFALLLAVVIAFLESDLKHTVEVKLKIDDFPVLSKALYLIAGTIVILSFRHVHHFVEELVENLFFHSWHVRALQLHKQIARIAVAGDEKVVMAEFMHAVQEYVATDGVAIYLQQDFSGGAQQDKDAFLLHAASLPSAAPRLDANHTYALEFRLGKRYLEFDIDDNSGLALALQVRGRVFGMVLLDQKDDGNRYRPDQIKLLCDACEEIALDLEKLRVKDLQNQHFAQQQELNQLHAELEKAQLQTQVLQLQQTLAKVDK